MSTAWAVATAILGSVTILTGGMVFLVIYAYRHRDGRK